jgi:putative membrane protein
MAEDKTTTEEHLLTSNDLAFERTILAENRTLMAWIRTAISMLSFGFTIYKFFHESGIGSHPGSLFTPRKVGMIMILLGLMALLWGLMEHRAVFKKLKKGYPGIEKSKTTLLALLVLLFGLALFLGALFKQ